MAYDSDGAGRRSKHNSGPGFQYQATHILLLNNWVMYPHSALNKISSLSKNGHKFYSVLGYPKTAGVPIAQALNPLMDNADADHVRVANACSEVQARL